MNDEAGRRTHALVSNLIRALTHKIRSPLSVISNELEALKAVLPAGELDSSRQRILQITEVLRSLSQFAVSPSPKQRFDGSETLREIAHNRSASVCLQADLTRLPMSGDHRLFSLSLNSICDLLLQINSQDLKNGAPAVRLQAIAGPSAGRATIIFRSECKSLLQNFSQSTWSLLSDFFNDELDLDSFLPACIDSILTAQSVTVSVVARAGIEISLHFSISE